METIKNDITIYLDDAYKERHDDVVNVVSAWFFNKILTWANDDQSVSTPFEQRVFAQMVMDRMFQSHCNKNGIK